MSSIRLHKKHNGAEVGAVISVPFAVGKLLIEQGIGVYLDGGKLKAGLVTPAPPAKAETAHAPKRDPKPVEPEHTKSDPPLKPEFPPTPTPHPVSEHHDKHKK